MIVPRRSWILLVFIKMFNLVFKCCLQLNDTNQIYIPLVHISLGLLHQISPNSDENFTENEKWDRIREAVWPQGFRVPNKLIEQIREFNYFDCLYHIVQMIELTGKYLHFNGHEER
jgi:hypothetical protein